MARLRRPARSDVMRYGENPHQRAASIVTGDRRPGVATARQLQGKQLSYNNINDTDAAFELVGEFDPARTAAVAIIKHANPCGVAKAPRSREAYRKALRCDPVSAFGGIVALNRPLDAETAEEIVKTFTEVIIAPDARRGRACHHRGQEEFAPAGHRRPARSARRGPAREDASPAAFSCRSATMAVVDDLELKVVTKRAPSERGNGRSLLRLPRRQARQVERHRLCQGRRHGRRRRRPDEPGRFLADRRAQGRRMPPRPPGCRESPAKGSVVASDAFFPFADGLLAAVEAGATAVIQPGGSMRDDEVIAAADDARHRHGVDRHAAFPALSGEPGRPVRHRPGRQVVGSVLTSGSSSEADARTEARSA